MAVQETDRFIFGSGLVYVSPVGASAPIPIGEVSESSVDIKVDQKGIWGEGGWAVNAFDGERSIDISVKNYKLSLAGLANDFNGTLSAGSDAVAFKEPGVVPAVAPFTAALAQGATYRPASLALSVYILGANNKPFPVLYNIVAAGSEVAGVSASVSALGVITFAAADKGLAWSATYRYGTAVGSSGNAVTLSQTYQNSTPFYTLSLFKRDRSPIDNSVGILILDFYAVRPAGVTLPFKENDASSFDRKFMPFADPLGNVCKFTFVNV